MDVISSSLGHVVTARRRSHWIAHDLKHVIQRRDPGRSNQRLTLLGCFICNPGLAASAHSRSTIVFSIIRHELKSMASVIFSIRRRALF